MNNKLNNMLNDFFKENEHKNMDEMNEALKEFIQKYNDNEIPYENTLLDDAYELLIKAENANTEKEAIKLAKQAYELCPDCFDAILFLTTMEENSLKREKMLDEGLEKEKKRLVEKGYFKKDNIGHFYQIFETRPYIHGLNVKASNKIIDGKLGQAKEICKEILKLNESDNTGSRYLLMALYALFEEEKELLELYKKYPEENLEMLFPLFAIYYKKGEYDKAKDYLNKINKANPNLLKFYKNTMKEETKIPDGCYTHGEPSEIFMYFNTYFFLIDTMNSIDEFILENSKKYVESN